MKFLTKNKNSSILKDDLKYKKNYNVNNKKLKERLLKEQKNFCAYTEKYIHELDSTEVEHFNSSIKYNDNYYNYYGVIRATNLFKISKNYSGSLFFQNIEEFKSRIKYKDFIYSILIENDKEAQNLISFLGFNNNKLYIQRKRHVKRLRKLFDMVNYEKSDYIEYFKNHKEELSFITALEYELDIKLANLI